MPASGLATLGLNLNIFVAQLVNVLIVFVALRQWAFKPLLAGLEARRLRIEKSEADAKKVDQMLAESKQQHAAMLIEAKREAQAVRETAAAEGEQLRKAAAEKARADVEGIVNQGKAALVREREQLVQNAHGDMASLAVAAAEKILGSSIDHKKAEALATDAMRTIAS